MESIDPKDPATGFLRHAAAGHARTDGENGAFRTITSPAG